MFFELMQSEELKVSNNPHWMPGQKAAGQQNIKVICQRYWDIEEKKRSLTYTYGQKR